MTGKEVIGHCLLIEDTKGLALVDTGIGLLDTKNPIKRIGQQLINIVGFQFNEDITAIKQIEQLGLEPNKVKDCIISHLDPDHIGGLADFPAAVVHVGEEEFQNFKSGNPRYLPKQLEHNPIIKTYGKGTDDWYGFEARKIHSELETEIYLIPLFGHTLGHCGIAIKQNKNWLFYIGDAYYLNIELTDPTHPVNDLAKMRADSNELRIQTLNKIRKLINEEPNIIMFGYHDMQEFKN